MTPCTSWPLDSDVGVDWEMWDTSQLTQCLLHSASWHRPRSNVPVSCQNVILGTKQSVAIIFEMYRAYSRDHPQSLLEPLMPTQPRQERCQVQSQHLMGSSSEKYAALVKTRPQVMISLIIITQWPRLSHHRAHFHFSWDFVTAVENDGVSFLLLAVNHDWKQFVLCPPSVW